MSEIVRKTDFAKYLGVVPSRITQYLRMGLPVRRDGKIDIALATEWMRDNLASKNQARHLGKGVSKIFDDRAAGREASSAGGAKATVAPRAAAESISESDDLGEAAECLLSSGERPMLDHADAVKKKENYLALLRELEYDRESGKVVEVSEQTRLVAEKFAIVRNHLLSIPARSAARIVLLRDPQEAQDYLAGLIAEALEELSSAARTRAAELTRLSHDRR